MRLAKVENALVIDVIVADESPGYVPCPDHVGIGMPLDAAAPAVTDQPTQRIVTASDFRDRFTPEEMDAVLALAYSGDTVARRLLLKLQTQTNINLDSPELIGGLDYLVAAGLLVEARKFEVLG